MKKKAIWGLTLALTAALAASSAWARPGDRPEKGLPIERMMEKLDLSAEQVEQLRALEFKGQNEQIDRRAAQAKAQLALREQMSSDDPDAAACSALIDELASLAADGLRARLQKNLAIREILTLEQWQKYQKLAHSRRGRGGRGGRPGQGEDGFRRGGFQKGQSSDAAGD